MNGEGCDLSVPSPALAGYLGNAEKRGAVNGACPWCSAKGQINVLRSYKFNFKDSITLCTGPLCLFPLVSGPLDNIRAILSSSQDIQGCKRKFYHKVEPKDPDPSYKFRKKEDPSIVSAGKCWNVDVGDCSVPVNSIEDGLLINDHQKKQIVENADNTTEASHANCKDSGLSDFQIRDSVSSTQDKKCEVSTLDLFVEDLLHMVPTRQHLFWKNKDNLCWLDSLLVALVHIRIIREASCENVFSTEKFQCKDFTVKNLCVTYQKSCTYIKAKEQHCQDNIVRVHSDDLYNVEQELEALRMSAFQFLQPKLQCDLGPEETPVFALPLLLKSDDWANSLFQHAGQWEFWCTSCGYNFSTSMEKTVTTFSQIKSDWHPLKAVQVEKCRNCHNKNQKRKLVLQRISSVLALHFLEGLPRRDLSKYAFDFHGTQYNIRTIIQYNEQREHFVTWIHQPDGLWLEFDDLKHPHCITHRRFALPANQLHLVFWEAGSTKESQHRDSLPDNSLTETMSKNGNDFQNITNSLADDTCIIESLTGNKDSSESASNLDSSIGSTTLLDTFEGLSHSDIVTLTLVEVQADVKEDSCPNNQEMVTGSAESSVTEAFHLLEKSSYQTASNVKNNKDSANNVSHTPELILPSVVKSPELVDPSKVSKCPPTLHSSDPSTSHLLLDQQAFHQSTPLRVPHHATDPRIDQRFDCSEPLLAKPAELFGGYRKKNSPNPGIPGGLLKHSFVKLPTAPQKPFSCPSGITTVNSVSTLMKSASQNIPIKSSPSKMVLSTEALRLKLMKRLKAKKKKLAKLNQLLSIEGSKSTPRPDSTDVCSPYSVTSSTSAYDSPAFDHFFAELLSPDMSTSNQSPDSTGLLEMLTNSQAAGTLESSSQENSVPLSELPVPLLNDLSSTNETFLELNPGSRELENAELNAMDIFF